jgi:Tfp pilus assembly protein PilO
MYAKRNSLTILAFLLLLSGVGFFWYRSEAKDLQRVSDRNKELNLQLRGALEVAETLAYVTAERDSLQRVWEKAPKKILNTEEPAFSLSYINWLIRTHNLALDFDFFLNDKKSKTEYTVFTYTLSGEGDYRNICALVWHMTNNPLLYHIKSVTMRRSENDPRLVSFSLTFEGYSMNKDWEVEREVAMAPTSFDWQTVFSHDSFESLIPLVVEPKPEPKVAAKPAVEAPPPKPREQPGLLDVESATLLAITNDKAYLRAKDGKVVPLKVGDQVRLGRLTRLDPRRNQVEFQLETESGSSRMFQLNIEYN